MGEDEVILVFSFSLIPTFTLPFTIHNYLHCNEPKECKIYYDEAKAGIKDLILTNLPFLAETIKVGFPALGFAFLGYEIVMVAVGVACIELDNYSIL